MKKIKAALTYVFKDLRTLLLYSLSLFVFLIYYEMLLYYQIHSSFTDVTIWNILFLLPIAFVLSVLSGIFKKYNHIVYSLVLFAISVFYMIELIYYKTFGSLLSISMVGTGTDAVTNFWWSISTTIKENILVIIAYFVPIVIVLLLSRKNHFERFNIVLRILIVAIGIGAWFGIASLLPVDGTQDYSAYAAYHSRYIDTDTASRKLGVLPNAIVEIKCSLFGSEDANPKLEKTEEIVIEEVEKEETVKYHLNMYTGLSFLGLKNKTENSTIKDLCTYLTTITPTSQNEYTGMFKDYNLIYICAESFSRLAVNKDVTPTLYKMANNGIVLNNFYNSFKNVTTNGEYSLLTGLWPDVAREQTDQGLITGTMGQSINKNMSQALGNMFNNAFNISSYGYHNFHGYYYGRNKTLPNMGFTCKFMDEGMTFTTSWPASDYEMMQQSVGDYVNDEQFCVYYMTFSGHGNYSTDNVMVSKNMNEVIEKMGSYKAISAMGYLSCNYELDKAMEYLLDELEKAGKLDNTVIVIAGDHYPYYLTDYGYEELNGKKDDDAFESFKSTCIIYNAGLDKPIQVDTPCCNVDILPTILNLFGVDYDSRLYAGTDIFSNGTHVAQFYNRSFVTDKVMYDSATGKATWLINTNEYDEELLNSYLDSMINIVRNKYIMSIEIEDTDFYDFVFSKYSR